MKSINICVVGVGNCASSLIQGIHFYRDQNPTQAIGLRHWDVGGYKPGDIKVVAAFDVDKRKVGRDIAEAIFSKPNCTKVFFPEVPLTGISVRMGAIKDGIANHMSDQKEDQTFLVSDRPEATKDQVVAVLKESKTDVLVNYLPVGSEEATKFYADCSLEAGVAFVNNIPVFIASDDQWARRFQEKGLPLIGDDIKSQLGATVTHRVLTDLFKKRGVKIDQMYQLNTGGNTDFLNMRDRSRLDSKKKSKTEAVQSAAKDPLPEDKIHVGPSDYVPWQKDNKVSFIRMEGRLFGDVPMNLELRLSVEDSPNSAGVAIDAIRCAKLALDRGQSGVLYAPSAAFCKHPPKQYSDEEAYQMTEAFIQMINVGKPAKIQENQSKKPISPVHSDPKPS